MEEFDISTLFGGFDNPESLALIFFMIVSFLLGFLAAFLLRSRVVRRLRKALKASNQELEGTKLEIKELRNQLELKEADIHRLKYEINEGQDKVARLETERNKFYTEAYKLKEELVEAGNINQDLEVKIKELDTELLSLKATNDSLKADVFDKDHETENLAQMQSVYLATKRKLESTEEHLKRLQAENTALRNQLGVDPAEVVSASLIDDKEVTSNGEYVDDDIDFDKKMEVSVLDQKIDLVERQKDNLTLIDGIGPFLEKKLNEAGIFTYAELAAVSADQIPQLTRSIGHIPGRIERDDWIGQAAKLADSSIHETPDSFEASTRSVDLPGSTDDSSDLTVIEGIGPILQSILHDAGINNWQDLAETNDEELRSILLAEGPGYQIIDPSSWPAQAQLAINGDWDLLTEYRDEVSGKQ